MFFVRKTNKESSSTTHFYCEINALLVHKFKFSKKPVHKIFLTLGLPTHGGMKVFRELESLWNVVKHNSYIVHSELALLFRGVQKFFLHILTTNFC